MTDERLSQLKGAVELTLHPQLIANLKIFSTELFDSQENIDAVRHGEIGQLFLDSSSYNFSKGDRHIFVHFRISCTYKDNYYFILTEHKLWVDKHMLEEKEESYQLFDYG